MRFRRDKNNGTDLRGYRGVNGEKAGKGAAIGVGNEDSGWGTVAGGKECDEVLENGIGCVWFPASKTGQQ